MMPRETHSLRRQPIDVGSVFRLSVQAQVGHSRWFL